MQKDEIIMKEQRRRDVPCTWSPMTIKGGDISFSVSVVAVDLTSGMQIQLLHSKPLFAAVTVGEETIKLGECSVQRAIMSADGSMKLVFASHLSTWLLTTEQQIQFLDRLITLVILDLSKNAMIAEENDEEDDESIT